MKLILNTITTKEIEVSWKEFQEKGFDKVWDEIRNTYSAKDYEVTGFKETYNANFLIVTLKSKKYLYIIDN